MKRLAILVSLVLLVGLASSRSGWCQSLPQDQGFPPNAPYSTGRYSIPSISFLDGSGRAVDLGEFRGRYVLLNLWATWCGPCVSEMSSLEELQRRFNPGQLTVVAIAEDHDGLAAARYFYMHRGLQALNIYADPSGESMPLLHARGLPTSILVDPRGAEIARFEGAVNWTSLRMLGYLQSVMR